METKQDYFNKKKQDTVDEKIIGEFLDRYFYPDWCITVTRNNDDLEAQYRGVDLTTTSTGNTEYVIDEKAAAKWRNLTTFSMEISANNSAGEIYKGWFTANNQLNNYYTLVWLDDNQGRQYKKNTHLTSTADISDCTVALVDKKAIYNWLHSKNVYGKDVWKKQTEIREAYETYGDDYWKQCRLNEGNIKYSFQNYAFEKAVNILIPRQTLINLSKLAIHFKTNNGVMEKEILNKNCGI